MIQPEEGQIWRSRKGKERLRVGRIYETYEGPTLRCDPLHGGRYLVTSPEHLNEAYELEGSE